MHTFHRHQSPVDKEGDRNIFNYGWTSLSFSKHVERDHRNGKVFNLFQLHEHIYGSSSMVVEVDVEGSVRIEWDQGKATY